MALIADLLLIAAALGAAFYCFILSRRLTALNSAEGGIGQAIATLSDQVARLEETLEGSRSRAEDVDQKLRATVARAEELEQALVSASGGPQVATQPAARQSAPRADTQPASFRRRLFAETRRESET